MLSGLHKVAGSALALTLAFCALLTSVEPSRAFDSNAPFAYLYDVDTKTVLYAHDADTRFAPLSLTKIVTAATVFDLISSGTLSGDAMFPISENAWRRGGAPAGQTTMFAELNSTVSVDDLLSGMIIQMANDGAIALAEGIDGSEAAFTARMQAMAERMGMARSHLTNPAGLRDGEDVAEPATMTARDAANAALFILAEQGGFFPRFSVQDFTWNGIFQRNRNPLLLTIDGSDGMMIGGNDDQGYHVVGTVIREGRRVIFVLAGLDTPEARVTEARRIVDYAYNDFHSVEAAGVGETIADVRVYGGAETSVGLVADGSALHVLMPREGVERVRARVVYEGPVPAPIEAGQTLGELIVERDGLIIQRTTLVAAHAVPRGSLFARARDGLMELLFGWIPPLSLAGDLSE